MTAKDYLNQYKNLTWEIERIERDIRDIESTLDSISINYNGMPHGSGISKKTENLAIKLSTLKDDKIKKLAKAKAKREEIVKTIAAVKNPALSKLLYDRYIEFMSWERIAEDIGDSEFWPRETLSSFWTRTELHSRALDAVDKIIKKR